MAIPSMVACPVGTRCVAQTTQRVGLSVKTTTWCGDTHNAADGVIQVPNIGDFCPGCTRELKGYIERHTPPAPTVA